MTVVVTEELRTYLVPRDLGMRVASALARVTLVGLAVALTLATPAERHDAALVARKASEFESNYMFAAWALAGALVTWRVVARITRPMAQFATAEFLEVRRSILGREALTTASGPGKRTFRNPLSSWWEVASLAAGDGAPLLASLALLEIPALLSYDFGASVQAVAAAAVTHVVAGALLVWALPMLVDRALLAMQLAVGLRRRRPRTSQLTISSDPFWRDLGRAHRRAPLAGSEADR